MSPKKSRALPEKVQGLARTGKCETARTTVECVTRRGRKGGTESQPGNKMAVAPLRILDRIHDR